MNTSKGNSSSSGEESTNQGVADESIRKPSHPEAEASPSSPQPQPEVFPGDSLVVPLKQRTPSNPCFGLVLNTAWPPPEAFRPRYDAFVSGLRASHPSFDTKAYLYPFHALHVTVATAHAFTRGLKDSESEEDLYREWAAVIEDARGRDCWPTEALSLEVSEVSLFGNAVVMQYTDVSASGVVAGMRKAVLEATSTRSDALRAAGIDPTSLKIPNIIHSTILRWTEDITGGECSAIRGAFESADTSSIIGYRFENREVNFVRELVPYMHIDRSELTVPLVIQLGPS